MVRRNQTIGFDKIRLTYDVDESDSFGNVACSVRNLFEPLARRNYFGILVEIGIWSLLISVNYSYVMYIRYQGVRF